MQEFENEQIEKRRLAVKKKYISKLSEIMTQEVYDAVKTKQKAEFIKMFFTENPEACIDTNIDMFNQPLAFLTIEHNEYQELLPFFMQYKKCPLDINIKKFPHQQYRYNPNLLCYIVEQNNSVEQAKENLEKFKFLLSIGIKIDNNVQDSPFDILLRHFKISRKPGMKAVLKEAMQTYIYSNGNNVDFLNNNDKYLNSQINPFSKYFTEYTDSYNLETVCLLMELGADPTIKSNFRKESLHEFILNSSKKRSNTKAQKLLPFIEKAIEEQKHNKFFAKTDVDYNFTI